MMKIKQLDDRGFTLIELMIVLAIIGIAAGIAAMSSRGTLANARLNGATRQLYSDMQNVRLRAVKEGRKWAVQSTDNSYDVRNTGTDTLWNANDEVIKTIDVATTYPGVTITPASSRYAFNPNGTLGVTATVTLTVTNDSGTKSKTLCYSTSTGNVRIVEGDSC